MLWLDSSGRAQFGVYYNGVHQVGGSANLADGAWHHIAGTVGSSGMTLYVDGAAVGSDSGGVSGEARGTSYWRVGYERIDGSWSNQPGRDGFVGDIDDSALYMTALTAAQVQQHAQAPR